MSFNTKFYGYYSSYNSDKNFVTAEQDSSLFPPQVVYQGNTYRYIKSYQVSTPKQEEQFKEFCRKQNCEVGVAL